MHSCGQAPHACAALLHPPAAPGACPPGPWTSAAAPPVGGAARAHTCAAACGGPGPRSPAVVRREAVLSPCRIAETKGCAAGAVVQVLVHRRRCREGQGVLEHKRGRHTQQRIHAASTDCRDAKPQADVSPTLGRLRMHLARLANLSVDSDSAAGRQSGLVASKHAWEEAPQSWRMDTSHTATSGMAAHLRRPPLRVTPWP